LLADCAQLFPVKEKAQSLYRPLAELFWPIATGKPGSIQNWRKEIIRILSANPKGERIWHLVQNYWETTTIPKDRASQAHIIYNGQAFSFRPLPELVEMKNIFLKD
jgi:hypothetical protein